MSTLSGALRLATFAALSALVAGLALFDLVIVVDHAAAAGLHDFGTFDHAARQFLRGQDLYALDRSLSRAGWLDLNPPHFHLLLLPGALGPRVLAFAAWWAGVVAAALISVRLVLRELRLTLSPRGWLVLLALLLAWPGIVSTLWSGGIGYLLMLPMTLAWRDGRRGRWARAGAWLGVAMSVKLFLVVFLPWLAWKRREAFVAAVAAAAFVVSFGLLVFGIQAYASWIAALGGVDWHGWDLNASLHGMLTRLFADAETLVLHRPDLVTPLWAVGSLLLVSLSIFILGRRNEGSEASADTAFAVLTLAAILASPLGWIHYLVLPAGPVTALVLRRASPSPGVRTPGRWRSGAMLFLATVATLGLLWPRPWLRSSLSVYFWALAAGWLLVILATVSAAPGRGRTERQEIA